MSTYPVETMDERPVIVQHRSAHFVSLAYLDGIGNLPESLTTSREEEYEGMGCDVILNGKRHTLTWELYAVRRPGERPFETLERLGIDEENLLP